MKSEIGLAYILITQLESNLDYCHALDIQGNQNQVDIFSLMNKCLSCF